MRQPIPETPSRFWSFITQFAIVGCVLLLFGGLAVLFIPRLRALDKAESKIETLKKRQTELAHKREDLQNTLLLLDRDKEFIQNKARDLMDLKKEGETIYRFEE